MTTSAHRLLFVALSFITFANVAVGWETAYMSFTEPPGWKCLLQKGRWICQPPEAEVRKNPGRLVVWAEMAKVPAGVSLAPPIGPAQQRIAENQVIHQVVQPHETEISIHEHPWLRYETRSEDNQHFTRVLHTYSANSEGSMLHISLSYEGDTNRRGKEWTKHLENAFLSSRLHPLPAPIANTSR